ncbi:MAG TPA: lipid-A-disaccharide synthase [Candidatus Avisuccinivibrio pullicola]|nr:lipid-A-disaccharide synthase [Candidatus Avisuccinivibrio pullicola]
MSGDYNRHLYALIACEASGDTLGAGLMRAILRRDPKAQFMGIGGPKMTALGMASACNMEELSVMGLTEVLSRLLPILKIRREITSSVISARPSVLIGIDAPDFNLSVEEKVRESGIPTVHYVSPSVWAWREGRLKKIRRACDEVLALLPFEKEWYDREGMACAYVGHTLACEIPLENDRDAARARLDLKRQCVEEIKGKVMAIMAGSRKGELTRMVPVFARTARLIRHKLPDTVFISATPSHEAAVLLKDLWLTYAPDISLTVFVGEARDVMASADATLVTSGTVAFEAMLVKCPLAVAYKVSALSAAIGRRLLKVDMFSLPNLLAGRRIVSEFIQEQCTPEALAEEMLRLLNSDNLLMKKEFMSLHQSIRVNSDELAARAVFKVIIDHKSGDEEIMEKVGRELTEPAQAVPGGTSTEETKPERPVLRVDPPLEEPEEEELAPPAVSEKPRV